MSEPRRYKYPLHLPESLKKTAVRFAKEDGVSKLEDTYPHKSPRRQSKTPATVVTV